MTAGKGLRKLRTSRFLVPRSYGFEFTGVCIPKPAFDGIPINKKEKWSDTKLQDFVADGSHFRHTHACFQQDTGSLVMTTELQLHD